MTLCRIVASLTTIPKRINHILPVLRSLTQQKIAFQKIYLNLARDKVTQVPTGITRLSLEHPELTINWVEKDLGPMTKLAPALLLETDPETRVVTFDDDAIVHPSVSEIIAQNIHKRRGERVALSFSGWVVGSFPNLFLLVSLNTEDRDVDWVQGCHSITYRRGDLSYDDLVNFRDVPPSLQKLFRKHDDHHFSWYLAQHNINRVSLGYSPYDLFTGQSYGDFHGISSTPMFIPQVAYIGWQLRGSNHYMVKNRDGFPAPYFIIMHVLVFISFMVGAVMMCSFPKHQKKLLFILLTFIFMSGGLLASWITWSKIVN